MEGEWKMSSEIEKLIETTKRAYLESLTEIQGSVDRNLDAIGDVLSRLLPLEQLEMPAGLPELEIIVKLTLPDGQQSMFSFYMGHNPERRAVRDEQETPEELQP